MPNSSRLEGVAAYAGPGPQAPRLEAARLATALGVTKGAVSQWLAAARAGRRDALLAHPRPGPSPKLAPEQIRLIPDFLWHGPEAYGFPGEFWTCDRVADVLREELGV